MQELKPGLRIFRMVLDKLGIEPEEVLYIDDDSRNTGAAQLVGQRQEDRKGGIHVITFEDSDQLVQELQERYDVHVLQRD